MEHSAYQFQWMPKLIITGSFDWDDHWKGATLVDDPDVLRKTASSPVVAEWGDIKPIKNASLIHLIALGAREVTGPNRNGDGFKAAFLRAIHHTFKKHGALYRDHINKNYDKRDGDVIKTAFNDEMGRAELLVAADHDKCADWLPKVEKGDRVDFSMGFDCFDPQTLVRTINGDVAISDLKVGDTVMTHTGRFMPIEAVLPSWRGNRQVLQIKMQTRGEAVLPTSDHQVLVVRREAVRRPSVGRWANYFERMIPEWVVAGSIKVGDYMLRPVMPLTGKTEIDPRAAYLLGQYIGDGTISKDTDNSVAITTNVADTSLLNKMVNICLALQWDFSVDYLNYDREICRKKQATVLRIREPEFARLCETFCGRLKDKYVRQEVWSWTMEAALNFLGGYVDADGSYEPVQKYIRTSCVLDRMNETIQQLFFSVGMVATTWKDWFGLRPDGSGFANLREYSNVLFVNRSDAWKLAGYSTKIEPGESVRDQECIFFDRPEGKYLACPVNKVGVAEHQPEQVFCLTVAEDHSFVAEGAVVHNCKYDICEICDNKAKTRKDYCDCIKKLGMGKILPDGRKVCVDNPEGVFNDISKVGTGADQIAQHLRKVAGLDSTEMFTSGADLADLVGLKSADFQLKRAIAEKLSRMEKQVPVTSFRSETVRRVSEKCAGLLRQVDPSRMFGELAKLAVVLDLQTFAGLIMGSDISEIAPYVKEAQPHISSMFSDISVQPERLNAVLSNDAYEPNIKAARVLSDIDRVGLVQDFSVEPGFARDRLLKQALHGSEFALAESKPLSDPARLLLDEYAAYKLAALASLQFSDNPDTQDELYLFAVMSAS